jgi:DNA-binding GntR family transcriptional regulator
LNDKEGWLLPRYYRRVNRIRHLLSYQAMAVRDRYAQQCEEHLPLIDLLARGRVEDAAGVAPPHTRLAGRQHCPFTGEHAKSLGDGRVT